MAPHVVIVGQEEHPPPKKTVSITMVILKKFRTAAVNSVGLDPASSSTLGCTGLTIYDQPQ